MEWLSFVEIALVALVIAVLAPLVGMVARRRWIARKGGTFECSQRDISQAPGTRWVLGVARYSGEYFEWYRAFSLSLKPFVRLERARTVAVQQRMPTPAEQQILYLNERIVQLEQRRTQREPRELAMAPASLTGLLSWLESAPPGVGRYGNVAD